ncbi:MAG: hypothetical protein Q7S93_14110 [Phenylobacterium sp.]|nr:hypothetical protein [Phenylobacterium sp.]
MRVLFLVIAIGAAIIGFALPTPGQTDREPTPASQVATLDLN